MSRYDDILNVYGYLFSKSRGIAQESQKISDGIDALNQNLEEMDQQLDQLMSGTDDLLARAYALAEEFGLETSDVAKQTTYALQKKEQKAPVHTDVKIKLPPNFDFQKDFQRLAQEAHAAGFTEVHPRQLLSAEEMERASAIEAQLDESFAQATKLQKKDIAVLAIAVAMRVTCYFLLQKLQTMAQAISEEIDGIAQTGAVEAKIVNADVQDPTSMGNSHVSAIPIDAAQGVDINEMIGSVTRNAGSVGAGYGIVDRITKRLGGNARVLDYTTILDQNAPFEIQDTHLFQKEDIIAYNKYIGWVVGVANILTDTITTYNKAEKMKSYTIRRFQYAWEKPCVQKEIDTVLGIFLPVIKKGVKNKNSVIAATMQEALTLGYGKAKPDQVRALFGQAMELERRTGGFAEEGKDILRHINGQWAEYIGGIATITLINTVISAIHAINYEESDGTLDMYSVRTNRIILYSGAIASTINSLPGILAEDIRQLDFSGILTTCISLFQSTAFWIDAKAEFLISAYKQELDAEMAKLDTYFL